MPLVRISLLDDTSPATRGAIGDAVHSALVAVADVPTGERFQIVTALPAADFAFDRTFGSPDRQRVVLIEITMVRTLDVKAKRRLYRAIADQLGHADVRPDDLFVVLNENQPEDWSEARGEQSLIP